MAEQRPIEEIQTSGLLWLINRVVCHPRGYALAMCFNDDGNCIGWTLLGDGSEPWFFTPGEEEDQRFALVKELMP